MQGPVQQPLGTQELFSPSAAGNGSRISVEVLSRPPARRTDERECWRAPLRLTPSSRPASRRRVHANVQDLFKSMVVPGAPAPKQAPTPPQSTGRWERGGAPLLTGRR